MLYDKLAVFVFMIVISLIFFKDWRLIRVIFYCGCWQFFTEPSPSGLEALKLTTLITVLELAYFGLKVGFICWLYNKTPMDLIITFSRT